MDSACSSMVPQLEQALVRFHGQLRAPNLGPWWREIDGRLAYPHCVEEPKELARSEGMPSMRRWPKFRNKPQNKNHH